MFNEMLLEEGLARVAYVYAPNTKYVDSFRAIQEKARQEGKGIWSIEDYVHDRGFKESIKEVEDKSSNSGKSTVDDSNCTIKGNINSKGDKIYHMPNGQHYEQTIAEAMFCTPAEAEAAGFRASQR